MEPRFFRDHLTVVLLAAAASVALSIWCVYADPIINNDGILYVRAAAHFSMGDWATGFELYKWPFYSLLIAVVIKITGLSPELSAHALNAGLVVLLVVGFMALVHTLGGDRSTVIIAALVVLLFPALLKLRSFVIRDHGYLAFYLWSLTYLFAYWKYRRRTALAGWLVCAGIAALFRIEGAAFVAVVPALLALRGAQSRWQKYLWSGVIVLLAIAIGVGFSLWDYLSEAEGRQYSVFREPLQALASAWSMIGRDIGFRLDALAREFLGEHAERFALTVFCLALLIMVVYQIIKQLTIIYAGIVVYAIHKRLAFPRADALWLWAWLLVVHFVMLYEFAAIKLFVAGRYPMALVLTLLTAVPFALVELWRRWREQVIPPPRWVFPALIVLCFLIGVRGLDVFTDKHYLKQAGRWLQGNMPPDATLFSNNQAVIYYSGRDAYRQDAQYTFQEAMALIWHKQWQEYDYVAVMVGRRDREQRLLQGMDRKPVARFANHKGDKVLVFMGRK